ncbi:MAG: serpin family protein [Shewanella sp.]|nr:serpin family protein [Shewanella sp.]
MSLVSNNKLPETLTTSQSQQCTEDDKNQTYNYLDLFKRQNSDCEQVGKFQNRPENLVYDLSQPVSEPFQASPDSNPAMNDFFLLNQGNPSRPYNSALAITGQSTPAAKVTRNPLPLLSNSEMDLLKGTAKGINGFSVSLLPKLKSNETPNIIVCPQGQISVLASLAEGAAHDTQEQFSKSIKLGGTPFRQLTEHLTSYFSSQTISKTGIASINFFVAPTDTHFNPSYISKMMRYPNTLCYSFADTGSTPTDSTLINAINQEVGNRTEGKVLEALSDDMLSDSDITIGNVCCFLGFWEIPFKAINWTFNFTSNEKNEIPMLRSKGKHLDYALNINGWSVCKIPYQGCFEMLIAKPNVQSKQPFSADVLQAFTDNANYKQDDDFILIMPKFAVEAEVDLLPALKDSALKSLFDSNADYSAMTQSGNVTVSKFVQKTLFIVNEKGSFGQSVTGMIMSKGASKPTDSIIIDAPFVFAIKDKQTGLLLYIGMIDRPIAPTAEQEALIC